jgi:hypothetical protein
MYKCSNCGKKSISGWEKLSVGLFRTITCTECGIELGASYYLLFLLPLFSAIGLVLRYYISIPTLWMIVYSIVATLIFVFVYLRYIPLIPKQDNKEL